MGNIARNDGVKGAQIRQGKLAAASGGWGVRDALHRGIEKAHDGVDTADDGAELQGIE